MSFTSSVGVTGPQPFREVLEIGGASHAHVGRPDHNIDGKTFSELLRESTARASQPVSGINKDEALEPGQSATTGRPPGAMFPGRIVNTGNPPDLAIQGEGCFVLTDGQRDVYSRTGSFSVDANLNMIDSATGCRVKRIGPEGETDGFQIPGSSTIRVPYGARLPARATSEVSVTGNLSADGAFSALQRQTVASDMTYTYDNGTTAEASTPISRLDQYSGVLARGTITFGGYSKDGDPLDKGLSLPINENTTLGDIIGHLNTNVLDGATASLVDGRILITDDTAGYSRTDISLTYPGDGSLATPGYFEILTPGAEESCNVDFTVFDSQGSRHTLSAAFVRTGNPNSWDMVLTSVTGEVSEISLSNRRINAINFDPDTGAYVGRGGSEPPQFVITFAGDKLNPQTIRVNLGTPGGLDGLTQFAGNFTAGSGSQDGHVPGALSTISVNNRGSVIGTFSNGVRKTIGTLQIAARANTRQIESIFTLPGAFNRGAAKATDQVTATHGATESRRLAAELAVLREKLGFEKRSSDATGSALKSVKPDTRQVPVGKKLQIIPHGFGEPNGIEATVIKNDQIELAVKLAAPLEADPGAPCRVHYHFGASVWEFDASVISCHGGILVLTHSYDVRFINRRRFLRVPVNKPALIASFPFERSCRHGDNDTDWTPDSSVDSLPTLWGSPEFVCAEVTELAGPGLRIEAPLEFQVGERVVVIFKIGRESDARRQGASPHSNPDRENRKAPSRVVEDIGEVRHVRATENGFSIAVELTGLSDSNVSELIRETNSASIEAAERTHDANVSSEQQKSKLVEREVQLTA